MVGEGLGDGVLLAGWWRIVEVGGLCYGTLEGLKDGFVRG